MTAELAREHLVTEEEYLSGEELAGNRHEYLNGLVYAMAGTRTGHNRVVRAMVRSIGSRLDGSPCEPMFLDVKVRIEAGNDLRFYYPDLFVVCGDPANDVVAHRDPVLVAEVISASTRRVDQGEKLQGYLKISSLQLYLLVESESPLVIAHRRAGDIFSRETYSGLDAVIPLPFLQTELPLAELYAGISFATAS